MTAFLETIDKIGSPLGLAAYALAMILYIITKKIKAPDIIDFLKKVTYLSIVAGTLSLGGSILINNCNITTEGQTGGSNTSVCIIGSTEKQK